MIVYRCVYYYPEGIATRFEYSDGWVEKKFKDQNLMFSKSEKNLIKLENFYSKTGINYVYHYDNGEKKEKFEPDAPAN